jgi:outer membrane protein, multidrug efflux system
MNFFYASSVPQRDRTFSICLGHLEKSCPLFLVLIIGLLVNILGGCALTKDYERPLVDTSSGWRIDLQSAEGLANTAWWEAFQDPVINELIRIALTENKDLLRASARIDAAEASFGGVRADYYPQLDYGASAVRRQDSLERNYPFGRVVDRTQSIYKGFLSANWELDLWGRVRRTSEAARADLLATEEGRQGVILTLVSAVTGSYIELLILDKQLQIARATTDTRQESLQLFENKRAGGQVAELDLAQVRSSYEQVITRVPEIELRIAHLENALSVLLGRNPGPIRRGRTLDNLVMPDVPQGIPSDLLSRRPDIRQSEQRLIAAKARIGAARTRYFPSISLTGLLGYASSDLDNLLKSSANLYEVGGGLLGPIFNGGRIKAEIRHREALYEELIGDYQNVILGALREVNDALATIHQMKELQQHQNRLVQALKDYAYYAQESYNSRFTGYSTVLDAENKLFAAEIRSIQNQADLFLSMINIYKAMGGGWVEEADKLTNVTLHPDGTITISKANDDS